MAKEISLDDTLKQCVDLYPELFDILFDFGFTQIKTPGMLVTAGRFMTLRMGCELRKLDVNKLVKTLNENGFNVKEVQ